MSTTRYYRVSSVDTHPASVRFAVTVLGARDGDWVIVRPDHPTRPLVIQRHLDADLLSVLDSCGDALELVEEVAS